MKDMMQKMMGGNKDMNKMEGMNKMDVWIIKQKRKMTINNIINIIFFHRCVNSTSFIS